MKVSVLMITYNHEKFIAQAIDSILMQEVNFDYEIVIGEDCSTDNTRNIVVDFQKKYPDKIRLLLPQTNLGMIKNLVSTLKACQGEYIAILEGDDYWSSPHKLQKQVDFLERHPECTICAHDVMELYEDHSEDTYHSTSPYQKEILELEDLLKHNFLYTCTVMFRHHKDMITKFPDWYCFGLVKAGDYPLWVFKAQLGKIGYLHEVMATYRRHSGGVWSTKDKIHQLKTTIETNQYINRYLNFNYKEIIHAKISYFYYEIALEYNKNNNFLQAIKYFIKSWIQCPFNQLISKKKIVKELIKGSVKAVNHFFIIRKRFSLD